MADISIIIPVYNGEKWVDSCMKSIAQQTVIGTELKLELIVFNDGSTDGTLDKLIKWKEYFSNLKVNFIIIESTITKGVGAAKNGAIERSNGEYLCFQDIDDIMRPDRLRLQYVAAKSNKKALIGSKVSRYPIGSTPRFERWANNLEQALLSIQIYTSNGPTLLMPTWFCHRSVFEKVGGFDESGSGTPEDLIFFYKHLDLGGHLQRIDEDLVLYTYHEGAATFSVSRESLRYIQLERIERLILPFWENITIWNAGRAGRRLVRSLKFSYLSKISAFCDVDRNKVGKNIELYSPLKRTNIISLPVIHFSDAKPPLIICMKFDLTEGDFERNLKSLNLLEGKDYIVFN